MMVSENEQRENVIWMVFLFGLLALPLPLFLHSHQLMSIYINKKNEVKIEHAIPSEKEGGGEMDHNITS